MTVQADHPLVPCFLLVWGWCLQSNSGWDHASKLQNHEPWQSHPSHLFLLWKVLQFFWRWQCILSNPVINQDYTFFEMLPPRHYTLTTLPVNFIGQYLHWRQSIGLSFIWPSNVSMNQNATHYPSLYTNGYHAQSSLVDQICPCAIMQSKLLLTFLLWAPRQLQIWKDLPEQLHKHQLQKAISSILHDLLAFGSAPTNLLLHHMPNGPPSTLWCATLFRLETIILW